MKGVSLLGHASFPMKLRHCCRSLRQRVHTAQSALRGNVRCHASDSDSSTGSVKKDTKSTIADLDALLGIDPEEEARKKEEEENKRRERSKPLETSMSPKAAEALRNLKEATTSEAVESAIRKAQDSTNSVKDEKALSEAVRAVVETMLPESAVTPEVLKVIKTEILGTGSFLVTDVAQTEGGPELRGNCRVEPVEAADILRKGLKARYGDAFVVYLKPEVTEEAVNDEKQADGRKRVVLQVQTKAEGEPQAAQGWTIFVAIALLGFTLVSTLSLAALVAVPKLPPETLAWLASPDAADFSAAASEIPGLVDPTAPLPFLSACTSTFLGVLAVSGLHEAGHAAAAAIHGVKLRPALFLPNGSLGTFGAVTQVASTIRNRVAQWDIAAAGPLLGFAGAAALFTVGLQLSIDEATRAEELIQVPTFIFQGSIFLGSICEESLRPAVAGKSLVHPLLIAGWCGLFTQAFNCLPVGGLDGGRMSQASFGRLALDLTSVFTYLGLALGFVGGTMALPFGLLVLIAQRTPEKYVLDQVSEVGEVREYVTAAIVILSLLILVPFSPDAPELLDSMQVGVQSQLLQGAASDASNSLQI